MMADLDCPNCGSEDTFERYYTDLEVVYGCRDCDAWFDKDGEI
jgi:DNA-directed RNA polymerase subunit RPC12/RpoP